MKKFMMASLCLIITSLTYAQTSRQLSTDEGVKQVSINKDGSSEIIFSLEEFSKISQQTSGRLCLIIGSRKKDCSGGIGFRCGLFDCPMSPSPGPQLKEQISRQRTQQVELSINKNSVTVKFINPVDWGFLENN